jgi:hypothetical protein
MHYALYATIVGIIAGAAYFIGWRTGRQYGRDEQWVDDLIDEGRRNAARRDRQGQFKARSTNLKT